MHITLILIIAPAIFDFFPIINTNKNAMAANAPILAQYMYAGKIKSSVYINKYDICLKLKE